MDNDERNLWDHLCRMEWIDIQASNQTSTLHRNQPSCQLPFSFQPPSDPKSIFELLFSTSFTQGSMRTMKMAINWIVLNRVGNHEKFSMHEFRFIVVISDNVLQNIHILSEFEFSTLGKVTSVAKIGRNWPFHGFFLPLTSKYIMHRHSRPFPVRKLWFYISTILHDFFI